MGGIAANWFYRDTIIDATHLDENTWYPVTIRIGYGTVAEIECAWTLEGGIKPYWATHASGYAVLKRWTTIGSGWGVFTPKRVVLDSYYNFCPIDPVRGVGQLTNPSLEYVFVRGGGKYHFRTSKNADIPELHTSKHTQSSMSIEPTTATPEEILRTVQLVTEPIAKANTLATPRTIYGQVFDGSNNVSGDITTANNFIVGTIYQSCTSVKRNFDQGIRLSGVTKDNSYSIISFGCDPEAYTNTHANQWTIGRSSGNNFICDRNGSDGSKGFIITTAGNMGIGRADASYKLDVNGTARCSTLTQTSDARLKENVADYELPLAVIANAPSVTYNWKADGKQDIGGIAQYWEQAQPLLTDRDNEGMLSMEYGKTAYLAAVTLAKEMERLQADNTALRAELAELRDLVKGLIKGTE